MIRKTDGRSIGLRRIVILGTGTGVGKTYFSTRLIEALKTRDPDADVVGIKPIETGFDRESGAEGPPSRSDARALERVSRGTPIRPHPLLTFPFPVSPHLAARLMRRRIRLAPLVRSLARHGATIRGWQVVETAGGVFSPLGPRETNFDLAMALEPAVWVLVAPDALGVLHEVRATLTAMRASGREPDHLVLSAARSHDASVGTNAAELPRVRLPRPTATLQRGDKSPAALHPLITKLLQLPPHLRL